MSGWLLDTNVLSELRRKQPEPAVERFVAEQPLSDLYIGEVTFAEIRFGIELIGDPERRAGLQSCTTGSTSGCGRCSTAAHCP